ncbi:20069_t:CDS:1, partial [Gigaspora rosea]
KQKAKVKLEEEIRRKFTPFQEEPYQLPPVKKKTPPLKKNDTPSKKLSELPMPQNIPIDFCLTNISLNYFECI